jgi:uncharacterized integral membrane protein
MQLLFWLIFLIAIGIAIFAVQNSNAPPVMMKFLIWQFETSLIYTIFGAIGMGIFVSLLFWIPTAIKASIRMKRLKRELKNFETMPYKSIPIEEGNKIKVP